MTHTDIATSTGTHRTHKRPRTNIQYSELCARHEAVHDAAQHVAERKLFSRIVLAVILINLAVLVWGFLDHTHEELVEIADETILAFFAVEVGLRLKAAGRRFWRDGWLWFDIVVIGLALLPLGADVIALRIMRGARILHVSRHLPHIHHAFGLRLLGWFTRQVKSR